MKNKRLLIIMSIILFLVLIVVFSSAIFSLKFVEVNFLSNLINVTASEDDIINSAEINMGESVFFLGVKNYTSNIESQNPYLKVDGMEVIFPNKLVIKVSERQEFYSIKLENNTYAICDRDLKVLKIQDVFINTNQNSILIDNFTLQNNNVSAGKFLEFEEKTFYNHLEYCLREWQLETNILKASIVSVSFSQSDLTIKMRSGVEILVKEANVNLSNKLNLAFSIYESNTGDYTSNGTINIYTDKNGNIKGVYSPN